MAASDAPRPPSPREVLERQNALLKQTIGIYDQLTAMVLQGYDVGAITDHFAELIGRLVYVLDPTLQARAQAVPSSERDASADTARALVSGRAGDPGLAQVLATVAEERRPLRIPPMPGWELEVGCVIAPISIGDTILGYLTIEEREAVAAEELDLLTVQHAATVYALAFMHERTTAELASRFKHDLLEGLLMGHVGSEQEARERALLVGCEPGRSYRLLLLRPEGLATTTGEASEDGPAALAMRRRILDAIVELVGRHAKQAVAVARLNEAVVLAPDAEQGERVLPGSPRDLARLLPRLVHHRFPSVALTIGMSAACAEPSDLPRAYVQTRRAVEIGYRFGRRGKLIAYDELGIYRLLFRVPDPDDLRAFAGETLGALVAYDRKHRSDFVQTLAVYLRRHGSPQQAARDLSVHVNTVSYRLQRIEAITGLRLEDPDDRLVAQIALKILEGLGAE